MSEQLARAIFSKIDEDELSQLISALQEDASSLLHQLQELQQQISNKDEDPMHEAIVFALGEIKNGIEVFGEYSFHSADIKEYTDYKEIQNKLMPIPYSLYPTLMDKLFAYNETFDFCDTDYIDSLLEILFQETTYAMTDDERNQLIHHIQTQTHFKQVDIDFFVRALSL